MVVGVDEVEGAFLVISLCKLWTSSCGSAAINVPEGPIFSDRRCLASWKDDWW